MKYVILSVTEFVTTLIPISVSDRKEWNLLATDTKIQDTRYFRSRSLRKLPYSSVIRKTVCCCGRSDELPWRNQTNSASLGPPEAELLKYVM